MNEQMIEDEEIIVMSASDTSQNEWETENTQ